MKTITVLLKAANDIDAVDEVENGHRVVSQIKRLQFEAVVMCPAIPQRPCLRQPARIPWGETR
jgi:hypothetical protein